MNVLKQAFLIWVKEIESAKLIWKDSWLVFIIFFKVHTKFMLRYWKSSLLIPLSYLLIPLSFRLLMSGYLYNL